MRIVSGSPRRSRHGTQQRAARLVAVVLLVLAIGCVTSACASLFGSSQPTPPPKATRTPLPETAIARENRLLGTSAWQPVAAHAATTQIQAYAGATSVQPGGSLTFYVSVQEDGTSYTMNIYRLGWYYGAGGRLMYSTSAVGHAQGYYDAPTQTLVGCATCRFDAATDFVEADWQPAVVVAIPDAWLTGVYLAKFTDANGFETFVSFDVLGQFSSTYVVVTADTTVAAYNTWGGHSFYKGIGTGDASWYSRAKEVSLDRPVAGPGLAQGLLYEIDTIRWMERRGYDVSYISSIDLDLHPEQILNHRAFISLGHDEYWSATMRSAVEQARDAGVGLAFIGGNDIYWQIRFEPDTSGTPDRTIICYKDPGIDPLYGQDNAHLTVQWRDPLIARPENTVMGIMYSGNTTQPEGYPWYLSPNVQSPLLAGTGLQAGKPYGCDVVGYEWDRVADNGLTPSGIHVIGTSATIDIHNNGPDIGNTAYYTAASGALVFDAGSVQWSYALDALRLLPNAQCAGPDDVVPGLQILMANVMAALVVNHPPLTPTPVATAQP